MRRFTVAWMASVALTGAVAAAPAPAAQSPVLTDCFAHGRLTVHYTTAELRHALNTIPASATEYTVCYDVVQRQLLAQLHPGSAASNTGSGSSSGGSFLPTPVIVVLVLLALGAVTFGAIAIRSRTAGGDLGGPDGGPPGGPGEGPPDEPASGPLR